MMRRFFNTAILLLAGLWAGAQVGDARPVMVFTPSSGIVQAVDTPPAPTVHRPRGKVNYHQDQRIERLMDDLSRKKHALRGFRVQIFLGDRPQAEELRRNFLIKHPDVPAYMPYQAPNFKVRVGDCRTRLEAEKLRQSIKEEFPGAYLVPDEIEMPRLPE